MCERRRKMKHLNLYEENDFAEKAFKKLLVHDSPYFKIINLLTPLKTVSQNTIGLPTKKG